MAKNPSLTDFHKQTLSSTRSKVASHTSKVTMSKRSDRRWKGVKDEHRSGNNKVTPKALTGNMAYRVVNCPCSKRKDTKGWKTFTWKRKASLWSASFLSMQV